MTLYKVLSSSLRSCPGDDYQWTPGEWTPKRKPELYTSGWHLCDGESQLLCWLGETIWIAESRGEVVRDNENIVVESARIVEQAPWSDREARLFECDCVEHVLHLYERDSNDQAPRIAIEIARAYAAGEAIGGELAAAWAAAWDAAWDARDADSAADIATRDARDAERTWQSRRLRWYLDGCPLPVPDDARMDCPRCQGVDCD